MTTSSALQEHETAPAQPSSDDWVLTLPLDHPDAACPSGSQFTHRGPLRVSFDGILFEQDDLARASHMRPEATPAEVIAVAYERGGDEVLSRLRGSFVVAVIDTARGTAVITRDPLGSHPLFYAQAGRSVLFATTPLALLGRPGVSRALNRAAVADHLCNRWPDIHETFFEAIRRVPPGWRAVIAGGRLRFDRGWNPVPDYEKPIEWFTEAEANRFGDVLDRAVLRCVSAGPTGIFLSGGFDSVSIAAAAADQARRNSLPAPVALSLAFPDPECDERPSQIGVAQTLGLRQHLVDFREAAGPSGLIAAGLELSRSSAAPLFNRWSPAYHGLARRAQRDGVRVILTGSGGDEWLGVSPYLAADLIRQGDVAGVIRFAKMWHRSYTQSWGQAWRGTLWTFGLRPLVGQMFARMATQAWDRSRLRRAHRNDPDWVAPTSELRNELRRRAVGSLVDANPKAGFYARDSRSGLDHTLMSRDLEEQYQFGRRLGVRFLHPYWDADLAAQIYRTPPKLLLKGGRSKGLVRETVAQRFPGLGFERQRKVSALSFFRSLLATEGPPVARTVGDFSALGSLGVIDGDKARVFVQRAFEKQDKDMFLASHLFNLEVWARNYVN